MIILLVEDEQKIAGFIKAGLEHEQFTVEVAQDGAEAVKLASVNDYDLVILDIMLPKKDGFAVCREMRDMNLTMPILMLTASDLPANKVKGLDVGADDYLLKPFDFTELLARIRALLRREKVIRPHVLEVGGLRMDTASHEVSRDGKEITLTGKEYKILEFLMRRPGMVCSRTMINEHVWGYNYLQSNTIDVHMNKLRKKIDGASEKKIIHTVHGNGYKIKA